MTEAQPTDDFPEERNTGRQSGSYDVYRLVILDTATQEIVADTQR
jgi:hypothetical protein